MTQSVEVKICGLTNRDDAGAALDFGADYLGFVLYTGSPRGITEDELKRIRTALPDAACLVGVFVNERPENILKTALECRLYAVQIHGDEKPDGFEEMPVPVWRAVGSRDGSYSPSPENWRASRYVVDAEVPGLYGGTGVNADWTHAARLAGKYPVMLAGGLTPDNVADAIRTVKPLGVDVASGVETEPGRKDYGKLEKFILQAKTYE